MEENAVMTTETQETEQTKKKPSGRHLTPEEQLERIEEKQKALQAKAAVVRQKIADRDRKARAHRLIQIGATLEAAAGVTVHEKALPSLEAFFREHSADIVSALGNAEQENEIS